MSVRVLIVDDQAPFRMAAHMVVEPPTVSTSSGRPRRGKTRSRWLPNCSPISS